MTLNKYKLFIQNFDPESTAAEQEAVPAVGILIPPNMLIRYPISKMYSRSSQWRVKVRCPWCGHWHYHGWGDPGKPEENRVKTRKSHCTVPEFPDAGYTIYIQEEVRLQNIESENISRNSFFHKQSEEEQ
jgi:hypothetical protein